MLLNVIEILSFILDRKAGTQAVVYGFKDHHGVAGYDSIIKVRIRLMGRA